MFRFFGQKVKGFMLKTCSSTFFNRNWKVGKERKSKMNRSSASKSLKKQPKEPKKGMPPSGVGSIPRAEPTGRGRGGVKTPPQGLGIEVCKDTGASTRPEARGLGGFRSHG